MKKQFQTQLEAIEWIANHAKDEGQFEVLREQLLFNYIYSKTYYIRIAKENSPYEVILFNKENGIR